MITSASTAFCKDEQLYPKDAEPHTVRANANVWRELPFMNTEDFQDVARGWIATIPDALIYGDQGQVAWSLKEYGFLFADKVPPTVNPSLWRQALLNMDNGLFKVTDGIYQVRGFDMASMMIIEGTTGIILIDPMTSVETARVALELYRTHVAGGNERPVKAVIYTHTHIDHYGGVRGVVSQADIDNGVKIIAPDGFLDEAISENIFAGNAMGRRALYQYGSLLEKGQEARWIPALAKENPTVRRP